MSAKVVIETVNLTRQYVMGRAVVHALRGVDLTVHEGEFLALMGASGSGKSTLLNMIGLLDRPTSGQYRLEDLEVLSLSRDDRVRRGQASGWLFYTVLRREILLSDKQAEARHFPRWHNAVTG